MTEYIRTVRLTSPTTEPITLAGAKRQLRIESTDNNDDTLLNELIKVARAKAENYCNRLFADATAALLFEDFPSGENPLIIPLPNIVSVDAVKYRDEDGAEQTLTVGTYDADLQKLWPAAGTSWPSPTQGIRIEVTAGAPVEIDAPKQAMKIYLTDLFENRQAEIVGSMSNTGAAEILLQPYRVTMGI